MNILAVTHLFPNEGNQIDGIFAARQLIEMKRQGEDITVLVPVVCCPGFLRKFKRWKIYNHKWKYEYEGLEAITVPYLRLPGKWYRPWAHRSVLYAIGEKVIQMHKAKPFDVIYARFLHPEGYAAVRLSKMLRVPAVGVGAGDEVNVYPLESRIFNRDFIRIVNELDGIIASGYKVAANIEKASGREPFVVHGVVDLKEFVPVPDKSYLREEIGLPPDKFIILYSGTYKVAKGLYELIDAFERISKEIHGIVLKICGYGRQEDRMRKVIKQKGLEHVIEIVGLVQPGQMHKWMQAADMFVLPSHEEGMPNAVMEAMACGLPVVASAVGGLPEEVGSCEGAILIQPQNIDALERVMLRVIRDEQLQEKMKVAARKKAEESFGVERNARFVLDYLRKVVEESKAKRLEINQ